MKKYALLVLIVMFGCVMFFLSVGAQDEEHSAPPMKKTSADRPSAPVRSAESKYVGLEKCKGCHKKEFDDFQKRKFGKAWRVLEMRGEINNPECLKCHATGYGQGGFVSAEKTPHLKYKQCEACHGPGSLHAKNPMSKEYRNLMRNYIRDNDVCINCHVCMFTHKAGFN